MGLVGGQNLGQAFLGDVDVVVGGLWREVWPRTARVIGWPSP